MGKKSWLQYPNGKDKVRECGVVASTLCRLNRGLGCVCGKWSTSKIFTEEELEIARNYDVKKALEQAISERKAIGL